MIAAMLALPTALLMQADVAAPLAPTSGWRLDTISGCTISRDFDRPGEPITLGFRQWPSQPALEIIVVRTTKAGADPSAAAPALVAFGKDAPTPAGWSYYFVGRDRVMTVPVPIGALATLAEQTLLTVTVNGEAPIAVRIEGIKQAVDQLHQCNAAAEQALGVPPDEAATIAIPPKPLNSWITEDDYPAEALRQEATGTTAALLRITTTGTVDDCQIVLTSGFVELDEATCRLALLRAKFTPALDAANKPRVSHVFRRIAWTIGS